MREIESLMAFRARRQRYEAQRLRADSDALASFLFHGTPNPVLLDQGVSYAQQWEEYAELVDQAEHELRQAEGFERAEWGRQTFRDHPLDLAHRRAC